MRALFVDFDDSFTFNVLQSLEEAGIQCDLIHWRDFENLTDHDLLILGPGPGHPDDYQQIFYLVEKWLKDEKAFFGVCLGHQIFWTLKGEKVVRSLQPKHGQKVALNLPQEWREWLGVDHDPLVQRYNSLCVHEPHRAEELMIHSLEGEIMITRGKKIITYQFHPESMGTTYRRSFFNVLRRHLV